jgi:hypothetical protein
MKNPIYKLFEIIPEDGSKILVTKELCIQILAWMRASDPKFHDLSSVDKLLWYLHKEEAITLSYAEAGNERINFISRKVTNGN